MTDSDVPPLEKHLGYWLRLLSNRVSQRFAERLQNHEITVPQWVVLRLLYDVAPVSLNEIAERAGIDKSSMSRLITRLIQRGMVLSKAGKDQRSILLSLSAKGQKLVPVLALEADINDSEFFQSLTIEKKTTLMMMIQELLISNGRDLHHPGKEGMA